MGHGPVLSASWAAEKGGSLKFISLRLSGKHGETLIHIKQKKMKGERRGGQEEVTGVKKGRKMGDIQK